MLVHLLRARAARYSTAVAATCATTAAVLALGHALYIPNISLLYLPVVLASAIYLGTGPSLTAATVAVLEYDFFLLRPVFTFTITQVQDVLAFATFAIVAILTGQLAALARERADAAQRRATESDTLYALAQVLMTLPELPDVLQAVTDRVVAVFEVEHCSILTPASDHTFEPMGGSGNLPREWDRTARAAINFAFQRAEVVGVPTGESGQSLYVPLRAAAGVVGVLEVGPRYSGKVMDPDEKRLLVGVAAQAALAIIRAAADRERQRLRVLEESDHLKSALLSAVSHDLRTPLASIKASATSLLLSGSTWKEDDGRQLLETIDSEADKLNRLVGNLLDLSRIEAGVLRPVLEWYTLREVLDAVESAVRPLVSGRLLRLDVRDEGELVQVDLLRIEALVTNLIENAVKYTPPGSPIEIRAWIDSGGVHLAVVDHGPGVSITQRGRIFETFYRIEAHGDRSPGTGLGLAICRGVAEVHGGEIQVYDTDGGGATFELSLPRTAVVPEMIV